MSSPYPGLSSTTPTGLNWCPPIPSRSGRDFCYWESPGGSVPRRAGASGRAGAIRCDTERARDWSGLSPRPENRLFGGAPPACQRPFVFWVALENMNNIVEMRFRVRKVLEVPHLVAPDSRRWRAVGRRALRAMGNISVRSAGGPCSYAPPPWRRILRKVRNKSCRDCRWLRSKGTGRRGPGQGAPGRGHGGLYHARLASFPIHMGALLTHWVRCSETGLGKFLEFFW